MAGFVHFDDVEELSECKSYCLLVGCTVAFACSAQLFLVSAYTNLCHLLLWCTKFGDGDAAGKEGWRPVSKLWSCFSRWWCCGGHTTWLSTTHHTESWHGHCNLSCNMICANQTQLAEILLCGWWLLTAKLNKACLEQSNKHWQLSKQYTILHDFRCTRSGSSKEAKGGQQCEVSHEEGGFEIFGMFECIAQGWLKHVSTNLLGGTVYCITSMFQPPFVQLWHIFATSLDHLESIPFGKDASAPRTQQTSGMCPSEANRTDCSYVSYFLQVKLFMGSAWWLCKDLATQLWHSSLFTRACKIGKVNKSKAKFLSIPMAEHLSGKFGETAWSRLEWSNTSLFWLLFVRASPWMVFAGILRVTQKSGCCVPLEDQPSYLACTYLSPAHCVFGIWVSLAMCLHCPSLAPLVVSACWLVEVSEHSCISLFSGIGGLELGLAASETQGR